MLGFNNGLNTMISQAEGSLEFELCGIYLNRLRVISTFLFIGLAVIC